MVTCSGVGSIEDKKYGNIGALFGMFIALPIPVCEDRPGINGPGIRWLGLDGLPKPGISFLTTSKSTPSVLKPAPVGANSKSMPSGCG